MELSRLGSDDFDPSWQSIQTEKPIEESVCPLGTRLGLEIKNDNETAKYGS